MLNLKLLTIASLIEKKDIVIDTCTDHAYLAIHLKKNNLCKEVFASDISANALSIAKKNIKNSDTNIKTFLSDGLKDIPTLNINTVVIAGVGTETALNIVTFSPFSIEKYIISCNNNHEELRRKMTQLGYFSKTEIVIKEKDKFYPIILFTKKKTKTNKYIFKYGSSNNKEYFTYLLNKENNILSKVPSKHFIKRYSHKRNIKYLKHLIDN